MNIDSGTVVLNGALNSAAMVNVNSGGTLAGNGTIDPPMTNGVMINSCGTLGPRTPGTAGGTLTITGSLTFTSGADYEIQLTPTAHASATVSGNLAPGGGTVELAPSGPLGAHYAASTFSILTYGGTLTGTFNPTVVYAGAIQLATTPTISYVPNNVDLSYGNTYADLATPPGANQNQQNVINAINNGILAGDTVPAGFQQLTISAARRCSTPIRSSTARTRPAPAPARSSSSTASSICSPTWRWARAAAAGPARAAARAALPSRTAGSHPNWRLPITGH